MLPSVGKAAERREAEADLAAAVQTFGRPRPVDPRQAMLEVLAQAAGVADVLPSLVAASTAEGGLDHHPRETLFNRWVEANDQLLRAAHVAVGSKLIEAQTDLARVMGDRLADLIEDLVRDLGHSPDDPAVDAAVRRRLALVGASQLLAIEGPQ